MSHEASEDPRQPWYDTTCCPPNLERTFASIPGYLYSTSPSGVYVNLYHTSTLDWHLEDGTGLQVVQQTKYPWDGDITLKVSPAKAATFTLYLRIPGWSSKATVTVDGKPAAGKPKPGEYFAIHREWQGEEHRSLAVGHGPAPGGGQSPACAEDYGRVAVQRGPLVYCLEQVDQEDKASLFDVALAPSAGPNGGFTSEFRPDILGGVVMLQHKGVAASKPHSEEPLYRTLESTHARRNRGGQSDLRPLLRLGQSAAGRDGGLDSLLRGRQSYGHETSGRRSQRQARARVVQAVGRCTAARFTRRQRRTASERSEDLQSPTLRACVAMRGLGQDAELRSAPARTLTIVSNCEL